MYRSKQNFMFYNYDRACINNILSFFLSFFLPSLVGLLLPTIFCCRGLLLHLVTLNETYTHSRPLGRTPLDEESASCRDLYLITRNMHNRQQDTDPKSQPTSHPQTIAIDRAVTGIGKQLSFFSFTSCLRFLSPDTLP